MYIRQGSVFITDEITKLPIDDLKVGHQIVLLSERERISEEHLTTKTLTLVLAGISKNIYSFTGIENYSVYSEDETDEDDIRTDAYMCDNQVHFQYLKTPNGLYLLNEKNQNSNYFAEPIDENYEQYIDFMHKSLYGMGNSPHFYFNEQFIIDSTQYHFLSFPLNDDHSVVFVLSNFIDEKKKRWSRDKHIYLITRDKKYRYLDTSFDEFLNYMKKHKGIMFRNEKIREFEEKIEIMEISKSESILKRDLLRYKMISCFSNYKNSEDIKELLAPIYVNYEWGMKVFSTFEYWSQEAVILLKDEILNTYKLEESDPELYEKCRVMFGMYKHFKEPDNVVDPITGDNNGEGNIKIIYKDFEGIIYEKTRNNFYSKTNRHYFIRIHDHYVESISKDEEIISEIENRFNLVNKIDSFK